MQLSVLITLCVVLVFPPVALGQTAADEIPQRVHQNQKVVLTTGDGKKLRGEILRVKADALTMRVRASVDVPYTDIAKIERPADSLWNGTLIGLAIGGVGGAAVGASRRYEPDPFCGFAFFDDCRARSGNALVVGLIVGAFSGGAIDALVTGDRTIYERGRGHRITMAPILGRRNGASVSVSW